MTREEAKKRLEVRLICANCPEDKMCYDSHLHSICEYTDYCDEVPIEEAVKVAIEALEQEPCDKCVYSTSMAQEKNGTRQKGARNEEEKSCKEEAAIPHRN